MRGITAFFIKDLKEFLRSREAMFWTFLFPIIFALLFSAVFRGNSTVATADIGYVPEAGENNISTAYIDAMENVTVDDVKVFHINEFGDSERALSDLKTGKIDALIEFHDNFTENITSGMGKGNIWLYYNSADPTNYQIVRGMLETFTSEFMKSIQERQINITLRMMDTYWGNQTNITFPANITQDELDHYMRAWMETPSHPVEVKENAVSAEGSDPTLWYATAAIGIVFMFSGMISSASSIASEREKGQIRRLATTKTRPWEMLIGKMLAVLLILYIAAFLVIVATWLVFGKLMEINPAIFGMLTIGALSTISIGLTISAFTKTSKAAAATNAIAWPISFITGIFFPSSLLPDWMRVIGDVFPTSALLRGIRLISIYHRPISEYTYPIISSIIMTIALLIIGSVAFRWRNRKE